MPANGWHQILHESHERYESELLDFLGNPSVSSLSEHAEDVRRAGLGYRFAYGRMEVLLIRIFFSRFTCFWNRYNI